jgi:hypothetical protein
MKLQKSILLFALFAFVCLFLPLVLNAQVTVSQNGTDEKDARYPYDIYGEKYSPNLLCQDDDDIIYDLPRYMHVKKKDMRVSFISFCCDAHSKQVDRCNGILPMRYDGNTLQLSAAEYGSLEALKYFIGRGVEIDNYLRLKYRTGDHDINAIPELGWAIKNDDFEMVRFLLGREEGVGGNKVRYSNPRRKLPSPDPDKFFKWDVRDFARTLKGKINPEIIKLVEEEWEKAPEYNKKYKGTDWKDRFYAHNSTIGKYGKELLAELRKTEIGFSLGKNNNNKPEVFLNSFLTKPGLLATVLQPVKEKENGGRI